MLRITFYLVSCRWPHI